jgi:hypothetical protein
LSGEPTESLVNPEIHITVPFVGAVFEEKISRGPSGGLINEFSEWGRRFMTMIQGHGPIEISSPASVEKGTTKCTRVAMSKHRDARRDYSRKVGTVEVDELQLWGVDQRHTILGE